MTSASTRNNISHTKKQSHEPVRKRRLDEGRKTMPRRTTVGPMAMSPALVIVVVIILSAIFVNIYPAYAQLTVSFVVKYGDRSIGLLTYRTDRLTVVASSSIKKDVVFLYSGLNETYGTYDLTVQVFYNNLQIMPDATWPNLDTGVYQITAVPSFRFEQTGQFYSVRVTAFFPSVQHSTSFTIVMPP